MKQIYLAIISLFFISLCGNSQSLNFRQSEEFQIVKSLHGNSLQINDSYDAVNTSVFEGVRSTVNDFGYPPAWDWVSNFGGSGGDLIRELVTSSDGSIFLTGSFSGEIHFEGNTWSCIGRRDAFIAKFQSDGSLSWFRQFSAKEGEKLDAYGIHLDEAGNVYFTGSYTGNITLGTFNLSSTQDMNLFLAKADTGGNITMAVTHPTTNPLELGLKVDTDDDGNIYVLASLDGTTNRLHASSVIKYDANGNVIMDFYHEQNFCDMKVMGQNIYLIGTINFAGYIGDFYFDPVGYGDAFVAKANTNMEFAWASMAGHNSYSGDSYGIGLYVSSNEEVFVIGYSRADIVWGGLSSYCLGGFLLKCSADGEFLWLSQDNMFSSYTPVDITGHLDYVYVSSVTQTTNQYSNIKSIQSTNGALIGACTSENDFGAMAVNIIDNTLITSQNSEGLIGFSKLDGLSLSVDWNVLFGGNTAYAYPIGTAVDKIGFQYQYGYASNQMDYFGQQINKGLFLAKQNAAGQPAWIVEFNNADDLGTTLGNPIVYDTNSNCVYIASNFTKPLVIPGGPTLTPDPYVGSFFILKYDSQGTFQWAVQENFRNSSLSLATDQSGNVLISGIFSGNITIGNTNLVDAGLDDIFVAKYNSTGQPVWAVRAGGEDTEWEVFISTDAQDNVYLTGEYYSIDVTVVNVPVTLEEGDGNIVVAKLDSQGNTLWVNAVGGNTMTEWADYYGWPTGIRTDAEGNSYIKGWCYDSVSFGDIMLTSMLTIPNYNNKYNKFISKLDTYGNVVWATSISEHLSSMDYNQFDIDNQGNVYCGLRVRDTTCFGEVFTFDKMGLNDLLVFKYSNEGQLSWVRSIEDSQAGSAWISSVMVDENQTVCVSGWFNDYLNFGSTSIEVNSKNGFIGVLGESNSISQYDQNTDQFMFDLFPNPADKSVSVKAIDVLSEITGYQITDVTGRQICPKTPTNRVTNLEIDISGYPSGVYYVKIYSRKSTGVKKLVIH